MIELINLLLEWWANWEKDDALNNLASFVTIISLVGAPIAYFVQKRHADRSERKRASRNLHGELNDTLDGLNSSKHNNLREASLQGGEKVVFVSRLFNHDFYDSLISSGKINFLKPELQQPIQDIFQYIKDHNVYLRKIRDAEDKAKEGENVLSTTQRYYRLLKKNEKDLADKIPKIQKKLKKEFKF